MEPIAVVGLSLRLPGGANDVDGLWKLLESGEPAWTPVPADRYNEEVSSGQINRQRARGRERERDTQLTFNRPFTTLMLMTPMVPITTQAGTSFRAMYGISTTPSSSSRSRKQPPSIRNSDF